ncbi:hypothetical protein BJ166DRAFT_537097 [Pestalotiopsis sp. NC0098]|nr:hypothetical protein BJ166DRAFT_537097 [Pestalotiopsis sp. NC0098]
MIGFVIPLLLAVDLASAAPHHHNTRQQSQPNHPPTQSSTGFRLIANVTDPSSDFAGAPVNGWILDAIHTGAGLNDAVLFADGDDIGRTYYVNGTADDVAAGGRATTLTDGGTPPFPYGVYVAARNATDADGLHDVSVDAGSGDAGVQLEVSPFLYPWLRGPGSSGTSGTSGTYVACDQYIPYYEENYTTVRWVYDSFPANNSSVVGNGTLSGLGNGSRSIPQGCVAITLLPECIALDDLPDGAIASHDFAANSTCYASVSDIDWTLYGP